MDSQTLDYSNFFLKGYVHGKFNHDVEHFLKYDFADCTDENIGEDDSIPNDARHDLEVLHKIVGEEKIGEMFGNKYKLTQCGMWEGVDEGSSIWHNDQFDGKTLNTNLLVYLDDNAEFLNNIQVRNGVEEYVIFPQKGDYVWLNQSLQFEHKAIHGGGRRRVLSFEYFTDGLDNKTN